MQPLFKTTQGKPKCSEVCLYSYGFRENADRMAESIQKMEFTLKRKMPRNSSIFGWIEGLSLNLNRDLN